MGRAAPEIDVFEATIDSGIGKVSQSAQWAPYNVRVFPLCSDHSRLILPLTQAGYKWLNNSDNLIIYDAQNTVLNSYHGGALQHVYVHRRRPHDLCPVRRLSANYQRFNNHESRLL